MVFVFQAGSPGLELMWDREREGPGTGAHNDSCISLYQEPGWTVPNRLLQTKKASSLVMLEIHTYFVHKIVLIKKTVFLDVILTSRYETGGWFNTQEPIWAPEYINTKPVGWVGDRTSGFNMNKKLFYFEEERNAPILSPKYSLLRLR